MNNAIDVPPYWQILAEKIYNNRGVVIVLGSPDTGKTTLINYLFRELNNKECPTSIIDADIGQSFYGVPTTTNLVKSSSKPNGVVIDRSYFVGSTSPSGHLLQMVVGLRKLLDSSTDCDVTLIDTTGFVIGSAAWELKYQKIDAVLPKHIVAIQRSNEIENILRPQEVRGLATIHRFPVHEKVKPKSPDQRRAYRQSKYRTYFRNAERCVFSLNNVSIINPYKGIIEAPIQCTLMGLNNNENFLVGLGILDRIDAKQEELACLAPISLDETIKTIRLGSVRLDSAYADYKL